MGIAFLGLGHMGAPMAANLLKAQPDLVVWNRTLPALERLGKLGATMAPSGRDAMRGAATVLLMLANEAAIDAVLERESAEFAANVRGRLIVHMGTTSPGFSRDLAAAVEAAGGRYVEAPVSGSRVPAEQGSLVAMVAGEEADIAAVRDLVQPMCAKSFACGRVPGGLAMKLAVNLFLITMVTGLMEAAHFARVAGLDIELFRAVIDAGPMSSDVSQVKLDKLVNGDFTPQASLADVLMNSRLVADAARSSAVATPLLDQAKALYSAAEAMGLGGLDMIGVVRALEQ
ncbi:NAD(P)-dependent oxidoreductase [Sphingomonas morindae]|uniref:NAD(P)-dependent oxidoreductase n=1 Tax=Sphingomonas morindae TaxID=1541170 RepID=A0ABY4XET0_9SPHN|nr:NAD(P)-dependent oxidoreductase [Sphingomonas morindae]USI75155.1 NAD(P)-dependent oxidoreductase [Sphingomonas morindae]